MKYKIVHTTTYSYTGRVSLCYNEAKLTPRNLDDQNCINFSIEVTPSPSRITLREDFFGNKVHRFSINEFHKEMKVTTITHIEKKEVSDSLNNFDLTLDEVKNKVSSSGNDPEIKQFLYESPLIQESEQIREYALKSFKPGNNFYNSLMELVARIHKDFEYKPGWTDVTTPLSEVIRDKKGVCQDFAHVAIACLRSVGIPARYVSGYLETQPPPGKKKLIGVDASHAWFSTYFPGLGWIDFDPTNNSLSTLSHITIGWGRDYSDIVPLKGIIFSSALQKMEISVDVSKM